MPRRSLTCTCTRRPWAGPNGAAEEGSLAIAMAVVLVLTTLSIGLLARTLSGLSSSRRSQDHALALAAADTGLADARARLDHLDATAPLPASIQAPSPGTLPSGASFTWTATLDSDGATYDVSSTGTSAQTVVIAAERATRVPRFPAALFATRAVTFADASAGSWPVGVWAETSGAEDPSRPAPIGTNGSIVLGADPGAGAGGTAQVLYGPTASCSGCPAPERRPSALAMDVPGVPADASACPDGGTVDGTDRPVTLPGGTYVCDGDLTLKGHVSTTPGQPVVIYLRNAPDGSGPPSTLHLGGLVMDADQDPTSLLIYKVGPGTVDLAGKPATFVGAIYAPDATLSDDPCALKVVGAIVLGTLLCDSPTPSFTVAYDAGVAALRAPAWDVSDYRQGGVGA